MTNPTDNIEQRARELLAAESIDCMKWGILNLPMKELLPDLQAALRAIATALRTADTRKSVETADEPVGEVFGPKAVSTMVALKHPLPPGTKLYPRPQPASIEGDERITCYGIGSNGERIQAVYSAQAICDMGQAQMMRSCANSLPRTAAPITVTDELRGEVAIAVQEGNRHTDLPTVRFWVDAVCNKLESFAKRKAGGE